MSLQPCVSMCIHVYPWAEGYRQHSDEPVIWHLANESSDATHSEVGRLCWIQIRRGWHSCD